MKLHSILNKGRGRRRVARPVAMLAAVGMALLGGLAVAATAQATPPTPEHQDYVCKYVGKPGEDERLQTGNNPIFVDTAATAPGWFADLFNDAQGRSYVIVADTLRLDPEPGIDQCPNGDRPPQPDPLVSSTQVTATTCTAFTTTTTTTTRSYVWSDEAEGWVLGDPVVTTSVGTRTPTADEIAAAGLVCTQPASLVTTRTVESTTCTAFTSTVITTTTAYVLTNGSWVLGAPVETTAAPVVTTPTAGQIAAAGLTATCAPPVVPTDEPEVLGTVENAPPVARPVARPVVLGIVANTPPAAVAGPGTLAFTGAETVPLGSAGLIMLAVGIAFTAAGRRRSGQRVRG